MEFDPAETDAEVEVLENARYIPVVVLGSISSTLSLLGSAAVMYMASRQLKLIKQRLLFCLSLADFVNSATCLLMPFLVPSSVGLPGAVGNHASCSAAGFFFAMSNKLAATYASYLSIYFLLIVRRNWKERDFHLPLEAAAHAFALLLPLVLDSVAVATESMNPRISINNLCLYSAYPPGCTDENDCERSSWDTVETLVDLAGIHFFSTIVVSLGCTALVWVTVRKTLRRSSRYRFEAVSAQSVAFSQSDMRSSVTLKSWSSRFLARASSGDSQQDLNEKRIRQVGTQALLYCGAYFHTCLWPLLLVIMTNIYSPEEVAEDKLNPGWYALQVVFWAFYPLEGALNFFIYTRAQMNQWREADPERSIFSIYKQILVGASPPTRSSHRILDIEEPAPVIEEEKPGAMQAASQTEEISVESGHRDAEPSTFQLPSSRDLEAVSHCESQEISFAEDQDAEVSKLELQAYLEELEEDLV